MRFNRLNTGIKQHTGMDYLDKQSYEITSGLIFRF